MMDNMNEIQPGAYIGPADSELLEAILPPEIAVTECWYDDVNAAITHGEAFAPRDRNNVQFSVALEQKQARQRFKHLLGLDNPASTLYEPYANAERQHGRDYVPSQVWNTVRAIHHVVGDVPAVLNKSPAILNVKGETLLRRHERIQRMAQFLGWSGTVGDVILARPAVLFVSEKRLDVVARLAYEHGAASDRTMEPSRVSSFVQNCIESQLLALTNSQRLGYTLGKQLRSVEGHYLKTKEARTILCDVASNEDSAEKIGDKLLKTYFRYRPPTKEEIEAFPQLTQFLRPEEIAKLDEASAQQANLIDGTESWLELTRAPRNPSKRKKWVATLNHLVEIGSERLSGSTSEDPRFERVVESRIDFFAHIGWSNSSHPLYNAYNALLLSREALVPTDNVVKIMGLLTDYDIDPVLVSGPSFRLLRNTSESIDRNIRYVLTKGLNPKEVFEGSPSLLYIDMPSLESKIAARQK